MIGRREITASIFDLEHGLSNKVALEEEGASADRNQVIGLPNWAMRAAAKTTPQISLCDSAGIHFTKITQSRIPPVRSSLRQQLNSLLKNRNQACIRAGNLRQLHFPVEKNHV